MRNIFSLCAICMVVFLSIIGCEEKKAWKACGYKVKEDHNDPGLKKMGGTFGMKSASERIKILNKAIPKATTLHARASLYLARSEAKTKKGDEPGAEEDMDEVKRLSKCAKDNGVVFTWE